MSTSEWIRTSKVLSMDAYGNVREVEDANEVQTATIWSYNYSLPIASGLNCNSEEFGYTSFENSEGNGWSHVEQIINFDAFTGEKVARVYTTNGTPYGPSQDFKESEGLNADIGYKASVWVKGPASAELVISVNNANPTDDNSCTGSGDWELLEVELTKEQIESNMDGDDSIRVFVRNNSATPAYFDDIRFYPADALCNSQTYDIGSGNVTSVSDENSNPKYYQYDEFNRLNTVKNENGEIINNHAYYYSRDGNGGDFNPADPNSISTTTIYKTNELQGTATTYFDGLGRKNQTQIDEGNDLVVSEIVYDTLGRQAVETKFARYFNTAIGFQPEFIENGWTIGSAMTSSSYIHDYYDGSEQHGPPDAGGYPYTYTEYYSDPLGRIKNIHPPGSTYAADHYIHYEYANNHDGEMGYENDQLFETRTFDENGKLTETQTDKFGNKVGTRVDVGGEDLITIYQYDIMGNLTKIIPPNAVTTANNFDENSSYCTNMYYNTLSQITSKQTPDADTVKYKYDNNGNLRFVQDQLHDNGGNDLIFYKYDAFNRVTLIGEATADATIPAWNELDGNITYDGIDNGDPQKNFENEEEHITDYVKIKYAYDCEPPYGDSNTPWANAIDPGELNNITGRMAAVAYRYRNTQDWGYTYYSYDTRGNIEWLKQALPVDDIGVKTVAYEYDLQQSITKTIYQDGGDDAFYIWRDYDKAGRLKAIYASITDSKPSTTVGSYTYWPTGQVKRNVLGNNIQGVDYVYNVRDWLTQINHQNLGVPGDDPGGDSNDRFGEIIGYHNQSHIAGDNDFNFHAQYNGNISWLITSTATANPYLTGFTYNYDGTNRLLEADYGYWGSSQWNQKTSNGYDSRNIVYDDNGNLSTLKRYGEYGSLTDLDYEYYPDSNKLRNTTGSPTYDNYTYDANGNLKSENSKNITNINYDYRNLPYTISLQNGNWLKYGYDAQGNRVIKKVNFGTE